MEAGTYPKKFFWARFLAFGIDWFLVVAVFAALTLALQPVTTHTLIPPSPVTFEACFDNLDKIDKTHADSILPLREGEERAAQICSGALFGLLPPYTQKIGAARKVGNVTQHRWQAYGVDADGKRAAYTTLNLNDVLLIVAPFMFAAFLSQYGRTPGKMLMGLRVAGTDRKAPSVLRAYMREALKYSPLILIAIYGLIQQMSVLGLGFPQSDVMFLGIGWVLWLYLAVTVLTLIYWFFPFLRWRGQTFYDKWLGLMVEHREDHGSGR